MSQTHTVPNPAAPNPGTAVYRAITELCSTLRAAGLPQEAREAFKTFISGPIARLAAFVEVEAGK